MNFSVTRPRGARAEEAAAEGFMGIKGLPEVLRPWLKSVQVGKYAGKRAAVDAYSWLHKGAYSCALELGTNNRWWIRQRRDAPYVRYCIHRAQMLRHYGITPVIVFDGDRLPAKGGEEKERRERRAECMRKGHERLAARDRDGATFMFAQGLDITPAMAHELIAALKREGFEFIVAPYEADAQIAALAQLGAKGDPGGVDIVFTEDSDLVAYGCPLVLFKLDKFGDAQELLLEDVMAGPPPEAPDDPNGAYAMCDVDELDDDEDGIAVVGGARGKRKGGTGAGAARSKAGGGAKGPLNFIGWKHEQFLELCVLSGCDFLPNIRGIGIKKAHALVAKHRSVAAVLAVLHGDKKIHVPPGYDDNFRHAFWTFRHARVYDPALRRLRPLNPMPEELEDDGGVDTAFLGAAVADDVAVEVAEGRLDPITRKPFVVPPSPQKQKGWTPRRRSQGGGGGGLVKNAATGPVKPPPKPIAFANLFAGKKAKTVGRGLNFDAEVEDDDLAAMMDSVENGRISAAATTTNARSEAVSAAAAAAISRSELGEDWTPRPGARQAGGGSAGGSSWVPTPYAVAPDTGQSEAPTGHETPVADENADTSPWGFEPVESTQRTAVDRRSTLAPAGAPAKNMFARSAPAKKNPMGALANLFAKQQQRAKENPMETKQAVKTYAAVAKGPSTSAFDKLRGSGGGGASQPVTGTQAKKATIAQFFNPGAKRAAEEGEETTIHRISDLRAAASDKRRKS